MLLRRVFLFVPLPDSPSTPVVPIPEPDFKNLLLAVVAQNETDSTSEANKLTLERCTPSGWYHQNDFTFGSDASHIHPYGIWAVIDHLVAAIGAATIAKDEAQATKEMNDVFALQPCIDFLVSDNMKSFVSNFFDDAALLGDVYKSQVKEKFRAASIQEAAAACKNAGASIQL